MPAGTSRLLLLILILVLQLACVTQMVTAQSEAQQDGLDQLFNVRDLPRAPEVAPHRKAPQFMLDFFKAVSDAEGTPRSQKEILDGTIVRSFKDKGPTREKFHFFNLSSLGREETLIRAEFRWFRKKFHTRKFDASHFYKVDLYEVMSSGVKPWRGSLITSRLVPLYTQGWEVFNVTQMVSKWIQNSEEDKGILVVTTFPYGNWMELMMSSAIQTSELTDTNAFLVIFSDDGRSGSNQPYLDQAQPTAAPEPQDHLSRRRRASSGFPLRGRSCHRVPLYVDFDEIGWSGWIISPRGYNAYHCKGSCPFPLGVGLRATNHATVRSIMHALKLSSDEVGAPCCVPDRLQSISLLYFDDEENVVLKQYDDMVALSCGCH